MSLTRFHLTAFPSPLLREHSRVEALCSKIVEDARFPLAIDTAIVGQGWRNFLDDDGICDKCKDALAGLSDENSRFVYIIAPGAKRKGEKDQEAA